MFDFWAFLLQTLSVSDAAVLILLVKALFKDKLPPKWQFAVWGVLGIIMLIPAGMGGRYTLINWRLLIEVIKSAFGDYGFTRVFFPFPVLTSVPGTAAEWLFAVYALGIIVHLAIYAISYLRLRRILRMSDTISGEKLNKIELIADKMNVKICKVAEINGLPCAFVCGVFRPVLVLPAEKDTDEKIILHELYHLKNKDTLWSIVICVFRSLHWCNPLMVYCAKRALADMEQRCDQYVLENLAGEELREYGHILLSAANDKYSKTPGSTSIGNGGKNIKARIANIARFKKYPQGMKLVSVCILILLVFPLVMGVKAASITEFESSVNLTLASARSTVCTTPAGAFDAYGKAYEGIFVVELSSPPDGTEAEPNKSYIAYQKLRVEKENGRWVAIPLEDFKHMETLSRNLAWGCMGLPGTIYAGQTNDFRAEMTYQTIYTVENTVKNNNTLGFLSGSYYNTVPNPDAKFTHGAMVFSTTCIYLGDEAGKEKINHIGLSTAPVYEGEEEPLRLPGPSGDHAAVHSSDGRMWVSKKLHLGWKSTIDMDGGGGNLNPEKEVSLPEYIIADLYLNNSQAARFKLTLQKGADE